MFLNKAHYEWVLPTLDSNSSVLSVFKEAEKKYSSAFLRLCYQRGIDSLETLTALEESSQAIFHDPFELFDMAKAIDRLQAAIASQEAILIYGDYDADGITSTLILYESLQAVGANVTYYIPNRLIDGYGPNKDRYQRLIDQGCQLILTCDNGVAGFEAIDYANHRGVDVIVTDHHEIQDHLPNAYAIVHPRHPQGSYPFGDLSGAGVALKVVSALLEEIPLESVELAAIGTVADLVSLTDENRTIVKQGLQLMRQSSRLGLDLILTNNQVDRNKLTSDTIGFIIGPRLNAIGRLGDPSPAFELLASFDSSEAQALYELIESKNQERQAIVKKIMTQIQTRIESYPSLPDIIIEADPDWPAGVVGIVAGRLLEKYHRPALVFQEQRDQGVYKGSGRSLPRVNLFDWLSQNKGFLMQFGGHSQAAGMTIESSQFPAFKEAMLSSSQAYQAAILAPSQLKLDGRLAIDEINLDLVQEIDHLGPFGMDNPQPLWLLEDVQIERIQAIGDQTHIKLRVRGSDQGSLLEVLGFSMADQCQGLSPGMQVSLVGQLVINEWQGRRQVQIHMKDIGVKGSVWLDVRGKHIASDLMKLEKSLYLYNHQTILDLYLADLADSSAALLFQDLPSQTECDAYDNLVIMEVPEDLTLIKDFYQTNRFDQVYLGAYNQYSKYLVGLPNRQEAAQLFRYLNQVGHVSGAEQKQTMQNQLKIHPLKINLLIHMFLEAKFVTIKDGSLMFNQTRPDKVDLWQLKAYRTYEQAMKVEALLNYQPLEAVKKYFEGN